MHEYFLHKARTILIEFEKNYIKDKEKAIQILKEKLKTERDKIRHITIDLLQHRYPEVKL
jgi:hypothetical protein